MAYIGSGISAGRQIQTKSVITPMTTLINSKYKTLIIWIWIAGCLFPLLSLIVLTLDLHAKLFPPYPVALSTYQSPANPNIIVVDATNISNKRLGGISLEMHCDQRINKIEASQYGQIIHAVSDTTIIDIPLQLKSGQSVSVSFKVEQPPVLFDIIFTSDDAKGTTLNEQKRRKRYEKNLMIIMVFCFTLVVVIPLGFIAFELYLINKKIEKKLNIQNTLIEKVK